MAFKMRFRIFKGKKTVEERNTMKAKAIKSSSATRGDFQEFRTNYKILVIPKQVFLKKMFVFPKEKNTKF